MIATDDMAVSFRRAPAGFTISQWREFHERGLLIIENAFSDTEIKTWREAVLRVQIATSGAREDGFFTLRNFVEADPAFARLIDHSAHVGLVYDLYGEMLKLQLSELFVRASGSGSRPERWHIDGPRVLPYAAFAWGSNAGKGWSLACRRASARHGESNICAGNSPAAVF